MLFRYSIIPLLLALLSSSVVGQKNITITKDCISYKDSRSSSKSYLFTDYPDGKIYLLKEKTSIQLESLTNEQLDSLVINVKRINLQGVDPNDLSFLTNVEHVELIGVDTIANLSIFPQLKTLSLWECYGVVIDENEEWLKKLEGLYIAKSISIQGVSSFENIPNLKELNLQHSGFKVFPQHINFLKCLQSITLGAYIGDLDLTSIDLTKLSLLKRMEVVSWVNSVKGFPKGIATSQFSLLNIDHPNLSKKEKNIIKEYNKNKR